MHRLAEVCLLASGWRRAAIAFLAGALGGLAMPPFGLSFVLFVSLPIGVWLIDGCVGDARRPLFARLQGVRFAAVDGWCFGFGFHVAGLWWLGAAFLVEPDKFAWLLPLGVLGLPAALGLFTAFGFALARLVWSPSPLRVFTFAAALTVSEFLRGTVLTGFPWNIYGMALGEHLVLAQVASIVGLYGLTVLALAIGALPAACVDLATARQSIRIWPAALAAVLTAGIAAFGVVRLQAPPASLLPGVKLRIMQPNIPQAARYDSESALDLVKGYIELSDRATSPTTSGLADVTHLLWPESPFPFALTSEPRALGAISAALAGRTVLMTGGVRLDGGGRSANAYNSFFVIGKNGQIADTYDKVHLVPFGEYLPLNGLLRAIGLRQFVTLPGGFSAGDTRRTIAVPGLPAVEALICYEAIFSGAVTPSRPDARRPSLLVNITNDAWYGNTPGPYQHYAQVRLRAVEEGVPLLRAANSGISAVIDGFGRVLATLPLNATGVLDSGVPRDTLGTIFARSPMLAPFALWSIVAALGLLSLLPKRRSAVRR